MQKFNVRVYAIVYNENNQILICDEVHNGVAMTKFPGGGLEWGEGIWACLERELMEEFRLLLQEAELFYVNDFFQQHYLRKEEQVIALYYRCTVLGEPQSQEAHVLFRWVNQDQLSSEMMTFLTDKKTAELLNK
jgi:8-oxo-dGTP diphosphatase